MNLTNERLNQIKRWTWHETDYAPMTDDERVAIIDRLLAAEVQLASGFTQDALAQEERAENAESRVAELEVQLAELRGQQEPIAYIIADKHDKRGYLSRKSAEGCISAEDINEHEITCTPLYAHPVPPAANQPYTVPDDLED